MADTIQYSIPAAQGNVPFGQTPAGQERRLLRRLVERAKGVSLRESTALIFLLNRWFYHRGGKGVIHPGAEEVAKAARCCLRTAKAILKKLRNWGFIVAVQYAKGGRNATRYMVDTRRILVTLGNMPKVAEGDLVPFEKQDVPAGVEPQVANDKPCNSCTRNKNRPALPRPGRGVSWLRWRLFDGAQLGLTRWIDPTRWLRAKIERRKPRKPLFLAGEVPF